MRTITSIAVFAFAIFSTLSIHAQQWLWARGHGGGDNDKGNAVCTDTHGNIIVVGDYMSSSIAFGNTTLNLMGTQGQDVDAFITKFDSLGNVLWSKRIASPSTDFGVAVCTDANNNIIVGVNSDASSLDFGNGVNITNNAPGLVNAFIAKFDPSGNVLWGYAVPGVPQTNGVELSGVATDPQGNVLAIGQFGTLTFCSFSGAPADTLHGIQGNNSFLLKLNGSNGGVQYVQRVRGSESNSNPTGEVGPRALVTDGNGNVYICGGYDDMVGNEREQIYVRKVSSTGVLVWEQTFGGNLEEYLTDIDLDAQGNIYVGGTFYSTGLAIGSSTLTNPKPGTGFCRFMASLSNSGAPRWATRLSESGQTYGLGVTVTPDGTPHICGQMYDTTFLGTPVPVSDLVVQALNPNSGSLLWELTAGQSSMGFTGVINESDEATAIATDRFGRIAVTGWVSSDNKTSYFGSTGINSNGSMDAVVARIRTLLTSAPTIERKHTLVLFPNPSKDVLYVGREMESSVIVEIRDMTGALVIKTDLVGRVRGVDVKALPPGIYLCTVTDLTSGIYNARFIKE